MVNRVVLPLKLVVGVGDQEVEELTIDVTRPTPDQDSVFRGNCTPRHIHRSTRNCMIAWQDVTVILGELSVRIITEGNLMVNIYFAYMPNSELLYTVPTV